MNLLIIYDLFTFYFFIKSRHALGTLRQPIVVDQQFFIFIFLNFVVMLWNAI